nr:putative disease resistance protein At1g50180 [Ziziphus jujuba var. spinosa]
MAEYIVSLVVEKVAGQLIDEAVSLSKVHNQVHWIEGELRRMQCFLKDADSKQESSARIRNWVVDIRDVAFDTDDVIDTYIQKATRFKEKSFRSCLIKRYPFVLCELIVVYKVNRQIERIKTRIHEITVSRSTYGIENLIESNEEASTLSVFNKLREKRRSSPHADEDDIVGLDDNIAMLESQLIQGELRRSVISIIGMAGLGKTTLAKKIYRSSNIKRHFDCCAWVYVSQEYRAEEVLQDLGKRVIGLGRMELEKMHRYDLVEELSNYLEKRRYIIVLDDIWKKEVWDNLKAAFPDSKNGSRIMFTTRFKDVALHADPRTPPHELHLLNHEDSWELLSKKVCLEWNSVTSLPPWTEEIGKKIVKRCGGLPLAIVVLGGLLSTREVSCNEWLKVLQSVHWQLKQDPLQCEDILALSYFDLPYYLKSCFLYFGLFPEDFEISARKLVLLWVAEGFVLPRGEEPLEDIAEDYLEELISRSMVQAASRKSNGRIKTCQIHDLLREFSMTKARDDRFLEVIHKDAKMSSLSSLTRCRRLAVHFSVPPAKNTAKLRSLLCFDPSEPISIEKKRFKLLRVLDLEDAYLARFDSAIGELIHLRYVGLRGTWLKKLPSSISYLSNLQTLDLRSTFINPFPAEILRLQQLRHLYFNDLQKMVPTPFPNTCLSNLQTLNGLYIDGTSSIENGLNRLTNLRELGLCGHFSMQEESLAKWIFNSKDVQCLKVNAMPVSEDNVNTAIPQLDLSNHAHLYKLHLEGVMTKMFDIQFFPTNLTELSLKGSLSMEDPMEKLEKLPNLRILKLKQSAFVGKEMKCSSGGFPQLQFLKLAFMHSVRLWRIEERAMVNLRELEIVECKRLTIVPRGLWPVTSLCSLKLGFMAHDFEVKVQERLGENWYTIDHVLPI